jgi:hypothetical protein
MSINTRLRSVQKSLFGRKMAFFWLKLSQERGGYLEYWKNAEFQGWPSESEEGGLLYYLALEVNSSVILAGDVWRQIASWAALLGISMIEASSESKPSISKRFEPLPERWREKLCSSFADLIAHEEAVDLISQGYFEGGEVLFADARQHLTASCESARELIVAYNWFAVQNGKEKIDIETNGVGAPGRVEQLLNQWVRLSRGKALVITGKLFEGRDEILSLLQLPK